MVGSKPSSPASTTSNRKPSRQTEPPREQKIITANQGGVELVRVPGGMFQMGSAESDTGRFSDEGPAHEVRVTSFYLGRYPVTNEQYRRFLSENPDMNKPKYWEDARYNQPRQPVVGVSWHEAKAYAKWAGGRLPSEAEWEYACRAGTTTRYHSGDSETDLARVGWYRDNSRGWLQPVGDKEPNGFGLYDMHGNVFEWVEDDWHDSYAGAPNNGSAWIDSPRAGYRVNRGGSWFVPAGSARAAYRYGDPAVSRRDRVGFRLARSNP